MDGGIIALHDCYPRGLPLTGKVDYRIKVKGRVCQQVEQVLRQDEIAHARLSHGNIFEAKLKEGAGNKNNPFPGIV
ncbi:hypothetical protein NDU88_003874 [Pleurodeles waltl]|uniref:Uncharacterized protein n=1 Tax=Pleurodeles waltl TaxID=8319 RepID=A0AAV7W3D3_PLEWA|nr:hypothetical protein NDU88_003874 [Pleurodeles waltl]